VGRGGRGTGNTSNCFISSDQHQHKQNGEHACTAAEQKTPPRNCIVVVPSSSSRRCLHKTHTLPGNRSCLGHSSSSTAHSRMACLLFACLLQEEHDPLFGPAATDNVRHGSFTNPTGPPPPYESVITDAASHSLPGAAPGSMDPASTMHNVAGIGGPLSATPGAAAAAASNGSALGLHAGDAASSGAPASHFEIAVADPVKQGEGVSAFVSYKVSWLAPAHGCTHRGTPRRPWYMFATAGVEALRSVEVACLQAGGLAPAHACSRQLVLLNPWQSQHDRQQTARLPTHQG
jgi:hypothetical protein